MTENSGNSEFGSTGAVRPRRESSLGTNHDGRAKRLRGRRFLLFHQRPETRARRRWMPKIVEMLWDIAFADGLVDEFEENTIWRIAELLGVSARDRVLRQRVAGQTPQEAPFEGPWSAPAKGKA